MIGITSSNKSTPFLNVNLAKNTIFIEFKGYLFDGLGLNLWQSTALGITDTLLGSNYTLKVIPSFDAWETEIIWSMSDKKNLHNLLTCKHAISENANKEWSV